jgi:glutathionylspermidine synthase
MPAMRRIDCPERDDWQRTAEAVGFDFHTSADGRYWDERAYYAFSLEQIEREIEQSTGEIEAMCLELVDQIVDDDEQLQRLQIPETFWPLIEASWNRDDPSLYGRLDLSFDGNGPAKLLEYNADTPTSIFEAAVFQWIWLEQSIERGVLPKDADQFNEIHDSLIETWREFDRKPHLHLAGSLHSEEDAGTLAYLEETARQAGLTTTLLDIEQIGLRDDGCFVDADNRPVALAFKLYPWEWMFREAFGAQLVRTSTRWIEPPWKAILSNKGILPLLWEMCPGHPNLLPAYFDDDPRAATLGSSFVRKPLYSREGANVTLVRAGELIGAEPGPYGGEGFVRQAIAPLPDFSSQRAVVGSWIVGGEACGLSIREDERPITRNTSRFVPHAIL